MTMLRGLTVTLALITATLEPVLTEPDIPGWRYGLTQGGLLVVVLVLLWYIREKHRQELDEKNVRIAEKDERLQVMVDLVSEVKVTLTKSVDGWASQAKATESLARAVEKIEERRESRRSSP